jgi:hypothetical protein
MCGAYVEELLAEFVVLAVHFEDLHLGQISAGLGDGCLHR